MCCLREVVEDVLLLLGDSQRVAVEPQRDVHCCPMATVQLLLPWTVL